LADPLFWLALSLLLVAVSLTAMLMAVIPAMAELSRAARSAEKLFDTLGRDLPPTLEALRLTGQELSDLTDDVSEGVHHAGQVVKQVDQSLASARHQAKVVNVGTKSVLAGARAAWQAWVKGPSSTRPKPKNLGHRPSSLPTPRPRPGFPKAAAPGQPAMAEPNPQAPPPMASPTTQAADPHPSPDPGAVD
jgi:ABC-type transporter Mla subunit MlaD